MGEAESGRSQSERQDRQRFFCAPCLLGHAHIAGSGADVGASTGLGQGIFGGLRVLTLNWAQTANKNNDTAWRGLTKHTAGCAN